MKSNFKHLLDSAKTPKEKEALEAIVYRALVLRQMRTLHESYDKQKYGGLNRTHPCLWTANQ